MTFIRYVTNGFLCQQNLLILGESLSHGTFIRDLVTETLLRKEGTSNFIGPWFTQMNCIMTCNPMNAHHIMSKNFGNCVKEPGFRNALIILGDSVLITLDSDSWKHKMVFLLSWFFKTKSLERLMEKIVRKKVTETCLVPLSDHVERQGADVDLLDVFSRFTFDVSCSLLLGNDPKTLAIYRFPKGWMQDNF